MTLVVDRRNDFPHGPGIHALIMGVSAYPHLRDGTGTLAQRHFNMKQLTSPAFTAFSVCQWLLDPPGHLPLPLVTCRLLLSPSPSEVAREPALETIAESCTLQGLLLALEEWRKDASTNRENIAFFYFAGHGVQRSRDDAILLPQDFGAPGSGGSLANTVALNDIYNGMVESNAYRRMAQTQLYFVDTCRQLPRVLKEFAHTPTHPVFDAELSGRDTRIAPIYFATVSDSLAYGVKTDLTVFGKALLRCLNGDAGTACNGEGDDIRWQVTVSSLEEALMQHNRQSNNDQLFDISGHRGANCIIHLLAGPPAADVEIEVMPGDAKHCVEVCVINESEDVVWEPHHTIDIHPYHASLPAGQYGFSGRIQPPTPPYRDSGRKWRPVKPPVMTKIQLKVDP